MSTPTAQPSFPKTLSPLINSQLLQSIFQQNIPWAHDAPPSGKDWADHQQDGCIPIWQKLCWEPLVALSKLDLIEESMPSFLSLLPEASSPEFPTQALALVILLDQAPRLLCNGVNERWRNGYFDPLALNLSSELQALPPSSRIDNFACWEKQGFSFAHWCMISVLLSAPFAHSEDLAIHEDILVPKVRERRLETERYYKTADMVHAKELEQGSTMDASLDTLAFSRLVRQGMPQTGDIKDCVFWFCRVKEAHVPIVRIFGRYPYRNRALGRVSTEAETSFLEKTRDFGVGVDEDAAKRIRNDVVNGVWSPLTSQNGDEA
jgi:uncharacterized protein (DUF924 family)